MRDRRQSSLLRNGRRAVVGRVSVLQVVPYFPPDRAGGVGEVARVLHEGFLDRGIDSAVLTSGRSANTATVRRVAPTPRALVLMVLRGVSWARQFEIVHFHHGEGLLLMLWLRMFGNCRLVLTLHTDVRRLRRPAEQHGIGPLMSRASLALRVVLDRLALRLADEVTAVSGAAAGDLADLFQGLQWRVIHNGVQLPDVSESGGPTQQILFVGSSGNVKRPQLLADVLEEVRQAVPEATLRVVGFDSEQSPSFSARIHALGLEAAVRVDGRLPRRSVDQAYRESALLVLVSEHEGMPMVVLEAMAHAVPCVAMSVGGLPEVIVDGVNGYLVPPDDLAAVAARCVALLTDVSHRFSMGDRARETIAARFSSEVQVAAFSDLYAQVANSPRSPRSNHRPRMSGMSPLGFRLSPGTEQVAAGVVILTSTLPVTEGDGVPRFVLDLSHALGEHFEVTLLAPQAPGARSHYKDGDVDVCRFRYWLGSPAHSLTEGGVIATNLKNWRVWHQVPFFLGAQVVATLRAIRRTRPIAVNAHWLVPQGLAAAVACAITKVPLVLHVHAGDVYLLSRMPFGRAVARFVAARSRTILADGSHVRDSLDALLGYQSEAELRPMGVWIERFESRGVVPRNDCSIVFVGRLVEKKGVRFLIDAMLAVRQAVPGVTLDIIGDGPLGDSLRGQAASLGMADRIRFLGPLSHEDVVERLHRAAVACVPSIIDSKGETEGMPTVVIETMAAGLRVVGSDVDGIPDVLRDRVNGWLARPADSDHLAAQLIAALSDPNGDQRVIGGLETAARHDWENVALVYSALLRGEPRG